MAKAARVSEEIMTVENTHPSSEVTIINFGDKPRVLQDARNRSFIVEIGGVVTRRINDTVRDRIKRRTPTLMAIPKEVVEHTEAPLIRAALEALRNFDSLSVEDAIFVHDKVFGRGHLGMRPTKPEIRMALAKRCKDAAEYIAAGAYETAEALLGRGRPEPVRLAPSADGLGITSEDVDIVKGDDDDDGKDNQPGNEGGTGGDSEGGTGGGDGETGGGGGGGDATGEAGALSGDGGTGSGGTAETPPEVKPAAVQQPAGPAPVARVPSLKQDD